MRMAHPARQLHDTSRSEESMFGEPVDPGQGLAPATPHRPLPSNLPLMLNARDLAASDLRYVSVPGEAAAPQPAKRKENARGGAVLRGIKDLQQLQKQTIA